MFMFTLCGVTLIHHEPILNLKIFTSTVSFILGTSNISFVPIKKFFNNENNIHIIQIF